MVTTIKLTKEHRGQNSSTFTGRPQGEQVRVSLHLSDNDKKDGCFEVLIPKGTTSFNPSFYLGLFFESIITLKGIDGFKNKYQITFEDTDTELVELLKEDIEDCERQAVNEYKRKKR